MTSATRVDLRTHYSEKEEVKALGARWDAVNRTWYAPPGIDLSPFKRWLPEGILDEETQPAPSANGQPQKGIALSELLARVKGVVDQGLPDAIWVRAEISELRGKNGHLYLTLTERNDEGKPLAQIKGIIWRNRAEPITAKFEQVTGEGLKTDIKILCLARVRFDVLYGLDLIIEDVDPSFTLGELAANLARIRERLQVAGLYDRNKRLSAPVDFVRVAVISPETSAGLGDFQRESDLLQQAGLCDFSFFRATFQGLDAPSSIRTAVNEALALLPALTPRRRLQLFALAYNLRNFLRQLVLPRPVRTWSLTTLREQLIKIGAKVVRHSKAVAFRMAEVAVPRELFAAILGRIGRLRASPCPG